MSPEGEQWARQLLAAAKTKSDLPALAGELCKGSALPCHAWPHGTLPSAAAMPCPVLPSCRKSAEGQQTQACLTHMHASPPISGADSNMLLMDDTSLENTFTCQPEHRNMHGRVFGGFLMRCASALPCAALWHVLYTGTPMAGAETPPFCSSTPKRPLQARVRAGALDGVPVCRVPPSDRHARSF